MDLEMKGKVALVTAASKGLGYFSALALAKEGAKVMMSSRSQERIDAAAASIRDATGAEVASHVADVSVQEDIDSLVKATLDQFGQIDILILNAGGPPAGNFFDFRPEDWEAATTLTLMSAVRLCYAVVPHMVERRTGSVTAIQSVSVKQPVKNLMLSNSIRMAVIGMLNSLATEVAPSNVRINSVNPTFTATERLTSIFEKRASMSGRTAEEEEALAAQVIPMGRTGDPEEFGKYVAMVASPALTFVTGQAFYFDGGAIQSAL